MKLTFEIFFFIFFLNNSIKGQNINELYIDNNGDSLFLKTKSYYDSIEDRGQIDVPGIYLTNEIYLSDKLRGKTRFSKDSNILMRVDDFSEKSYLSIQYFEIGLIKSLFFSYNNESIYYSWYKNGNREQIKKQTGPILELHSYYLSGNNYTKFYIDKGKDKIYEYITYFDSANIIMSIERNKSMNFFDGDSSKLNHLNMQCRFNGYFPIGPDVYYNLDGSIRERSFYKNGIINKTEIYEGKKKRIRLFDSEGNEFKNALQK